MFHPSFSIQPDNPWAFAAGNETRLATNSILALNSNVTGMLGILGGGQYRNSEAPTLYEKVRYEIRDLSGIVRRLGVGTTVSICC
jgi:hypothetical protein